MKKLISLLIVVLMVLSLAACGNSSAPAATPAPATEAPAEAPAAEEPAAEEPAGFELTGPVSFISPYATGGSADTTGRLVAQYLSEIVGQQVNVINREGASGAVGQTELAQSKPDGYTIGLSSISDMYVADYRGTFDINSVDYITWYVSIPFALYASPDSPWENIGELIEDIKGGATGIAMAESGVAHIIGLASMCKAAGIDVLPTVSFSSGGASQTALLGNHVDLASLTPSYYANVTAGGGKLMAIYGTSKLDLFPDMTYALDFDLEVPAVVGTNQIICLPNGCPDEVVAFWEDAMQQLLANEDFQAAMEAGGFPLCNVSGAELDEAVKSNNQAVADIMAELGLE